MKKIIALALTLTMTTLCFFGCSNSKDNSTADEISKDWPSNGTVYAYGENFSTDANTQIDGNPNITAEEFKSLVTGSLDTEKTTDPTNSTKPAAYIYSGEEADKANLVRTIRWCDTESAAIITAVLQSRDIFPSSGVKAEKDDVSSASEIYTFELVNNGENADGSTMTNNYFTMYLLEE